jgi:hypothetical protein
VAAVIAILAFGCRGDGRRDRSQVRAAVRSGWRGRRGLGARRLGRTAGPIDEARRRKLEDTGARLGGHRKPVTARIMVKRIGHWRADFVSNWHFADREPSVPDPASRRSLPIPLHAAFAIALVCLSAPAGAVVARG